MNLKEHIKDIALGYEKAVEGEKTEQSFGHFTHKIDPDFFIRMGESKFLHEDKIQYQRNTLFNDSGYTDREYHKQYPTIFHLRKALTDGKDITDPRLLYLAVSHIVKNRGHFLFEGEDLNAVSDFKTAFETFNTALESELEWSFSNADTDAVEKCLKKKLGITAKKKELVSILDVSASKAKSELANLLAGGKAKLSVIFDDEKLDDELKAAEISSFSLSGSGFEDNYDSLSNILESRMCVIDCAKALFDWSILADMLDGEVYISAAKVKQFNRHKSELALLKRVVRKFIPNKYFLIFRDLKSPTNYAAYVKSAKYNGKKQVVDKTSCNQADFCDFIKKQFKGITDSDKDLEYILTAAENGTLLPKQRTNDNSVVPYQVHLAELRMILKNAENHFQFLREKDEAGLTVSEKIIKLMTFRIPYYVGPLNDAHKETGNCWIVKRSNEKITPWNFDDVVDSEQSAENFILRMTNKCTYLVGEDVLPKHSIIYSRYMVLNDLNNIKVNGEKLDISLKQRIFNEIFLMQKKVRMKDLRDFLIQNAGFDKANDEISGIDGDFKSSMAPYIDFKSVLGDSFNIEHAESAIKAIVLFHEAFEKTPFNNRWRMFYSRADNAYFENEFLRLGKIFTRIFKGSS